ncbi:MAG: hypothetical protein WDA20_01955 [Desulfuromonadales bacterium]
MSIVRRKENDRIVFPLLAGLLFAGGLVVWLLFLGGHEADRAWRAFLVNFLFFTSLAGGLVTWSAIVLASNGRWPGALERFTLMGMGFAVPSLLALLALWVGSSAWAPWYGKTFHQGVWLDTSVLFGRNLIALLFFWWFALCYTVRRRRGEGHRLAGWLVFVYCVVWSFLGFDLVMALDPHWYSSLAGGYFFISGLYIAVACWALMACLRPETDPQRRHDLGKLVFAFSILTTYMFYAQLMPIWYENLPHEVLFLLPRMNYPWKWVSWVLVGLVFLGPLVLLLTIRAKRSRLYLGSLASLLLLGMWTERWWLVMPTFMPGPRFGLIEVSITAAFLGLAVLSLGWAYRRWPLQVSGGDE